MLSAYCSDACVNRLSEFSATLTGLKFEIWTENVFTQHFTSKNTAEYCVSIHFPLEGLSDGMFGIIIRLHCEGCVISFIAFI